VNYLVKVLGRELSVTIEADDQLVLDGTPFAAHLESIDGQALYSLLICNGSHEVSVEPHGNRYYVLVDGTRYEVQVEDAALVRAGRAVTVPDQDEGEVTVASPMPGIVVAVLVEQGQQVRAGEGMLILEAMKMENELRAPCNGTVLCVHVMPGQTVNQKEVLVTIEASG
jgi:pyruvate carboxylase subunit B